MRSKPKKRGMGRKKTSGKSVPVIMGKVLIRAPPPPIPVPGDPQPEDPDSTKAAASNPPSGSMCVGCYARCCIELSPEISLYDVARIMELEGKKIESFLLFQETNEGDQRAFKANGRLLDMTLRFEEGRCVFLNKGSRLKCSINDSKPAVCAVYPIKFLSKEDCDFMDNTLCPAENLAKARSVIQEKTITDARWEWDRHLEIVSDWNSFSKGDEDVSEFIAFAAKEMEAEKTPLGSLLRKVRRAFRKR